LWRQYSPGIRRSGVRSALRKLPFTTADSLYRDEPFYVDVILPEDEAKKAGTDLTVTLHSAIGNDSSSLGLSSFSPEVHRFAVYTTLDPVTMACRGSRSSTATRLQSHTATCGRP